MTWVASPTELTTGATDGLLAMVCILACARLKADAMDDRRRAALWRAVLALMALAAALGSVVHGLALAEVVQLSLWNVIYLALGLVVALFLVGAVYDWRGCDAALRLLPWALLAGVLFFALCALLKVSFLFFVAYEAAVMLTVLAVYVRLAWGGRQPGAGILAAAILANLAAAGVQASGWSWCVGGLPLDHNGLFHLVQIVATGLLAAGLRHGQRRAG